MIHIMFLVLALVLFVIGETAVVIGVTQRDRHSVITGSVSLALGALMMAGVLCT